jgi:large subunit ribosomal protein L10
MQKTDKERAVAELTERLRESESLIVADYRGLTNTQLLGVRAKLRDQGATFTVVKNTLTRRAAEAAGAEALLALLEGPTAIAFVRAEGDPVAVARALSDTAKDTKILTLRGGLLSGRPMTGEDVEELAKLPPLDALKGQVIGVILAPLTQLVGLLGAPLQDLVGLIDARITQLGEGAVAAATEAPTAVEEPAGEAAAPEEAPEPEAPEPAAEAAAAESQGEAEEDTAPGEGADDNE